MKTLWHHSQQRKTDRPVDSAELRRQISLGLLKPTDLVRRSGTKRWVQAATVDELLKARKPKWFYVNDQGTHGPFTPAELSSRAEDGRLQPGDRVWKLGIDRSRRADCIRGLFPVAGDPAPTPLPPLATKTPPRARQSSPIKRPSRFVSVGMIVGVLVLILTVGAWGVGRTSPRPLPVTQLKPMVTPSSPDHPRPGRPGHPPIPPETPNSIIIPGGSHQVAAPPTTPSKTPSLTPEELARLGRAVQELIVTRHEVEDDATGRARLSRAAASLLLPGEGKTMALTFTVLKSDEVFAFSHPGGYLYVSRGLFHFVRNDDELQFQLARELAHLEQNHLVSDAMASNEPAPDLAHRLYRQIALGYTDAQVFAADEQAFHTLRRLGRPAYKLVSWLSPAYDFNGEADPRGTRRMPASSPFDRCQEVENHWRSYPPAAARFERLRSLQRAQAGERQPPTPTPLAGSGTG